MESFPDASFSYPVPLSIRNAFESVWVGLSQSGAWWTGTERTAIAGIARHARPRGGGESNRTLNELSNSPDPILSALAAEISHKVAAEAGSISASWANQAVRLLGPGRYTELVAVIVQVVSVDRLCTQLARPLQPFLAPQSGSPSERIPSGLGQEGAFVPWKTAGWTGPNVQRALSYVPVDNAIRMKLVESMYAGEEEFGALVWSHRSLTRPQVEMLAARTSSINECFY